MLMLQRQDKLIPLDIQIQVGSIFLCIDNIEILLFVHYQQCVFVFKK